MRTEFENIKPDDKVYVLYHDDIDGLGSMYAADVCLRAIPCTKEYIPVNYNQPFPIPEENLIKNTSIFILDFAYDLETLTALNDKVKFLKVIDHHPPVVKKLAGFPNAVLDISKSGAVLSWEYFNTSIRVPDVIELVQDYDLYTFEFLNTRYFAAGVMANKDKRIPAFWDMMCGLSATYRDVIASGKVLVDAENAEAASYISNKKYKLCNINGLKVALYNTTTLISRLGEEFYNNEELNIDYAMSYFIRSDGKFVFNLRSKKPDGVDVSKIALGYGGGGHPNAAGFTMNLAAAMPFLMELYNQEK